MKVKRFEEKNLAHDLHVQSPPGKRGRVLAVDNQPANKLDLLLLLQLSRTLSKIKTARHGKKKKIMLCVPKKKLKKLKIKDPRT